MVESFVLLALLTHGAPQDLSLSRERLVRDYCDGARARGDVDALGELGEPARLALLAMADGGGLDAGCAFEHLANLDDERVLPAIRRSLVDESELMPVRRQAAAFAGYFGDVDSLDAILELLGSNDYGTMVSSVSALGGIDDERARRTLRDALVDESFELLRPSVIRSLGRQRDARAMGVLQSLAGDTKLLSTPGSGNRLRSELALAFARIGTEAAHAQAVEMVEGMTDPALERVAIRDVGREIRRQMDETEDDGRALTMDALLRRLAASYRALDPSR